MNIINWLDLFILILATFSINYLVINEIGIYFSNKSYLSRWVLCFLLANGIVLLKIYLPSSFIVLLTLAITGGAEFISTLTSLIKERKDFNNEKEESYKKILDITDDVFGYYQDQITNLKNAIGNADNSEKNQKVINNNPTDSKVNSIYNSNQMSPFGNTKIINNNRAYHQDEFLKESQGQKITLSTYLRDNLNKQNPPKK